jgi:hypothetical protein
MSTMIIDRKPPTPPDATYAEYVADLNADNDKLRGTIARLKQDLAQEKADKAALTARAAYEPEGLISLSKAMARRPRVGVGHEWIRRRLVSREIEGEKPAGRWLLKYSSLLKVIRAG